MGTDIFLIGGSAGSILVLLQILPYLDKDLPFPIVIILHRKAFPQSSLHILLETSAAISVQEAEDKTELENGKCYLAPANYHLLFENKKSLALDASEKVNFSRPSIDVTFESAARIFKNNVGALLLSGGSQDGVEGLLHILQNQGIVAIQDPNTAEVSYMPQQALQAIPDIRLLQPDEMATFINKLKYNT